jgi:hypothetical protein
MRPAIAMGRGVMRQERLGWGLLRCMIGAGVLAVAWAFSAFAAEGVSNGGKGVEDALKVLRSRVEKAVGEGKELYANVLLGGAGIRAKLVKCEANQVRVSFAGGEGPVPWASFDEQALADCARQALAPEDGEGLLALLQVYRRLGRAAAADKAFEELSRLNDEKLIGKAKGIMGVNGGAQDNAKDDGSAQPKSSVSKPKESAAPKAVVPLWSEKSAKWVEGGRTFFVGPEGTPNGAGTRESPWDLASVFSGGHGLKGGDVVWVVEGTYKGCFTTKMNGAEGKPIVVRAIPGQRAVLDSNKSGKEDAFVITGSNQVIWGLEIANTDPEGYKGLPGGYQVRAKNSKMINCTVHDVACCGFWSPAVDSEMNGNVLYYIGNDSPDGSRGSGHNMYTQNEKGTKVVKDNIIFYGFSFGIHAYTEGGNIDGYEIIGNTWFQNGVASKISGHKADCLLGGLKPGHRYVLRENMGWSAGMGRCVQFGYGADGCSDLKLFDNYFAGTVSFNKSFTDVEMKNNFFCGPVSGKIDTAQFPENKFSFRESTPRVFVRPNDYEPGRANVTVFNWGGAPAVPVDISKAVPVGAEFEVRWVENYFKGPVAGGVYKGGPVVLPMEGLELAQPCGMTDAVTERKRTSKEFRVFVVNSWTPGTRPKAGEAGKAGK